MINIYDIDNIITTKLKKNSLIYNSIFDRINIYNIILKNKKLINGRILKDIEKEMKYFQYLNDSKNTLIIYCRLSKPIIKKFVTIMNTPIYKDKKKEIELKKEKLSQEYLEVVISCIDEQTLNDISSDILGEEDSQDRCTVCDNVEEFIKENDTLICKKCYNQLIKLSFNKNQLYNPSLKKCNYDRATHFKECIKQYQGKHNTFINPDVYTDLKKALETQGLLNMTSDDPVIQFAKVKKSHIRYFLKELDYTKYYDDYILIHANLTEQKPPEISHIESELISEFEEISNMYSIMYKNIDRKNFINIQYILYKLLLKHNYPMDEDDFSSVKASDRNLESEKICKAIFESLGW
jgi:hypothetical protein